MLRYACRDLLLLTVWGGTGLVRGGECATIFVRYWAILGAGFCSWLALCRNVVVVRDGLILRISSCCNPRSMGMAFLRTLLMGLGLVLLFLVASFF